MTCPSPSKLTAASPRARKRRSIGSARGSFSATISDYGATLVSMLLPDGAGGSVDVLLGPRDPLANGPYFGASVGRVANRIAQGRFSLGGQEYQLATNDGPSHLHGGDRGFDKYLWSAEFYEEEGRPRLRLSRKSPAGEEGYPGNLEVKTTFRALRERRARHPLRGQDRRGDHRQPDEPRLLQPRRERRGGYPRPQAQTLLLALPRIGGRPRAHGRGRRGGRRPLRFPQGQARRRRHRQGGRRLGGPRLRSLLRRGPLGPRPDPFRPSSKIPPRGGRWWPRRRCPRCNSIRATSSRESRARMGPSTASIRASVSRRSSIPTRPTSLPSPRSSLRPRRELVPPQRIFF